MKTIRETEHLDDDGVMCRPTLPNCLEMEENAISALQDDFNHLVYNMICVLLEDSVRLSAQQRFKLVCFRSNFD